MLSFSWCAGPAAAAATVPVASHAATVAPAHVAVHPSLARGIARSGARSPVVTRAFEPASSPAHDCLRQAHAALGSDNLDVALGWFRHAAALDPGLHLARLGAALCLVQMGRENEGAQELAQAYTESSKPGEVDVALARLYVLAGQTQNACMAVGLAVEQDHAWASEVQRDPTFQPMRDHPMFLSVVGEL